MNITSIVIDRPNSIYATKREKLKEIGIEKFSREISIFFKEAKNIQGVVGHNLVSTINCLITNKSISYLNGEKDTLFNKTTYMCDIEFPSGLSLDIIKKNIDKFLDSATIIPTFAFSNSHIEKQDGSYVDLGLTIVNLDLHDESSCGLIELCEKTPETEKYKDVIYKNDYNPKYYNFLDSQLDDLECDKTRSGSIDDFRDLETKIVYNTFGTESVDTFIHGSQVPGIYVGKRVLMISEFMRQVFNKCLFSPIESITFIYDTTYREVSIIELKSYSTFNKNNSYLKKSANELIEKIITECCEKFADECKESVKYVCGLDKNFLIVDAHFYSDDRLVRITKPMYKLFGEFAINSESFINEVESTGDLAKADMIDQIMSSKGLLESAKSIANAICMIDGYTQQIRMAIEERTSNIQQQISGVVTRMIDDKTEKD